MSLDLEYFFNQMHIKDLSKLIENELKFIIRLFKDELEYFNIYDGFKQKGLIIVCNEMRDLLKDFRFILNGYIDVSKEKDFPFRDMSNTEKLITNMDTIDNYLIKIKAVRVSKEKVNELVDTCLLNIRSFYDSLNEYIRKEYYTWEALKNRQKLINKRECYMNQDKFNIDKQE